MKIGYLGGAFDPIHKDHLKTAKAVLDAKLVDRVIIIPCYQHKFGKRMADYDHRYEMVALEAYVAREEGYKIMASQAEGVICHSGSTYELLVNHLLPFHKARKNEVFWIIGGDNARAMDKWANWEQLIALIPFIIVERDSNGQQEFNDWYKKAPHFYLDTMVGHSSSTEVRKAIDAGQPFEHLVNPSTAQYIKDHGLYQ